MKITKQNTKNTENESIQNGLIEKKVDLFLDKNKVIVLPCIGMKQLKIHKR